MDRSRSTVSPVSSTVEYRAVLLSLMISILLLIVKFAAYLLTKSNAIFSDALETVVNVTASGFAVYSIALAHRPADREHPYGHGKIEFFSAGLEGGMILLAALLIIGKVVASFFSRQVPQDQQLGIGLILITIALVTNGVVGLTLTILGRRMKALTLEANGTHLWVDAIDSGIVLVALLAVRLTGQHWLDNAAALCVAAYISWQGYGLVRRSAAGLMDEQDAADEKLLRKILDAHVGEAGAEPRICSYHKLRHRHSGRYHWVDFHIMVPAWWDIAKGHRVASSIEYEIERALEEGNATAHVEPCKKSDCPMCASDRTSEDPAPSAVSA